jgi:hypothetical protein
MGTGNIFLKTAAMLAATGLLAVGCATAPASKPESELTLQYRVAGDAISPSRFVALVGDGMTFGLTLVWALPAPEGAEQRRVQQEQREEFDRLIRMLEARQINGAEFECTGSLRGFELHAATVPRLTEDGLRLINDDVERTRGR